MVRQLTRRSPQLAPLSVLLVMIAIGFVWFWQQAALRPLLLLAVGIAVAIIIDGLWGFTSLGHPRLEVRAPVDACVGDPMAVTVGVDGVGGPVLITMLSVPGSPAVRVLAPERGVFHAVPLVSGRFPWAIFQMSNRGPLGLVGWTRRMVVELPQPVLVAPRALPHEVEFPTTSGSRPGHTRGAATQLDLVRSIREYEPGDSSRLIHWGATARTGQLMTKELDPAGAGHLTIILDLRQDDPDAEAAAGRAAYLARRAMGEGWTVRLVNRETLDTTDQVMPRLTGNRLPIRVIKRAAGSSATVNGPVSSAMDVGRRLACADFGTPDLSGEGRIGLVRLVSSTGEDRWMQ